MVLRSRSVGMALYCAVWAALVVVCCPASSFGRVSSSVKSKFLEVTGCRGSRRERESAQSVEDAVNAEMRRDEARIVSIQQMKFR